MRKCAGIVLLWVVAVAGPMSTSTMGQDLKIGFVNALQILRDTEEGKIEIEKLNQFSAAKQQEIASRTSELQKLQEQYSTQQRTLNPQTRQDMERSIQDKERTLKRLQEDIGVEYNQRYEQLLGKIGEKVQVIINEFGPQNGYSVIFRLDQAQNFAYVDPSLNLTQEIINLYNQSNPVAGQATSAPASTPSQQ